MPNYESASHDNTLIFHRMDNMRLRNVRVIAYHRTYHSKLREKKLLFGGKYKDFLLLYNRISESCFLHCVNQLAERDLTQDETRCVDFCTRKFVNANHKVIGVYMEIQPQIINRRMEEMTQKAEAAAKESNNDGQAVSNPKELVGNSAAG